MARRKKKGAAFGKRTGAGAQQAYQRGEQRRVLRYSIIGLIAVILFCLAISFAAGLFSSGGDNSAATDSGIIDEDSAFEEEAAGDDEGFEAASDAVEDTSGDEVAADDDGFSASAGTEALFEPIDADNFTLLEPNGAVSELDPAERDGYYSEAPDMIIDESAVYEAVLVTERGDMRIRLFADQTPMTVNNFVALALDGFYDNTMFHRVLADFMAQGGDPSGTGAGGPGYSFGDEVDTGVSFDRRGLLAMANAGPSTNGSQFFITFEPTPWLTGNHTIFGELIEGDDVLASLRLRDPGNDPNPGDLIETIEIYVSE